MSPDGVQTTQNATRSSPWSSYSWSGQPYYAPTPCGPITRYYREKAIVARLPPRDILDGVHTTTSFVAQRRPERWGFAGATIIDFSG